MKSKYSSFKKAFTLYNNSTHYFFISDNKSLRDIISNSSMAVDSTSVTNIPWFQPPTKLSDSEMTSILV